VQLLLQAGADANTGAAGQTAEGVARAQGHMSIASMISGWHSLDATIQQNTRQHAWDLADDTVKYHDQYHQWRELTKKETDKPQLEK
jgi:hypothetical protein